MKAAGFCWLVLVLLRRRDFSLPAASLDEVDDLERTPLSEPVSPFLYGEIEGDGRQTRSLSPSL